MSLTRAIGIRAKSSHAWWRKTFAEVWDHALDEAVTDMRAITDPQGVSYTAETPPGWELYREGDDGGLKLYYSRAGEPEDPNWTPLPVTRRTPPLGAATGAR